MFSTTQKTAGQDMQHKDYLYQKVSAEPERKADQYTVFLVEDNIDDREQIIRTLGESPYIYDVHCFESGDKLVEYFIDEGYYDYGDEGVENNIRKLILMDIHLPGVNGMEIIRDLKEHPMTKTIPVIMTTGDTSAQSFEKADELQVSGYVLKPLYIGNIHEVIHRYLGQPVK